jgi:hypothetical protein
LTVNPDKRYTIQQFLGHPWIRQTSEETQAAADAPPLATPLAVREYLLETPGTAGAKRMDFRSPGAVNLREVFDVGYAVHRQEEEAKRRKNFKQGYRGGGAPGGMSILNALNEDDDDYDEDEYEDEIASKVPKAQAPTDVSSMEAKMRQTNLGTQPSAAAQARAAAAAAAAAAPATSRQHGQQQERGYGQHSAAVAAAMKQSVARKNRQPFELSLDNSTLLGRRNKGGVAGMQMQLPGQADKPSKLREELSAH